MKILVDMDGVLVNFAEHILKVHKIEYEYEKLTGDLRESHFYNKMDSWYNLPSTFWETIPWLPEGKELIEYIIAKYGIDNTVICTAPSRGAESIYGKIKWVERELPNFTERLLVTKVKELAASCQNILIDDNETNCNKFIAAGGKAILVPQPWNSNFNLNKNKIYSLEYIKEKLYEYISN